MNNYTPNAQDQKKAENIRRSYISREESKIEQLKALDGKVKAPGRITGIVLGVVGALVMGAGMSFVTVWDNMVTGLALGIPGLVVAAAAYPIYSAITNRRRQKYADKIIALSDEVIGQ